MIRVCDSEVDLVENEIVKQVTSHELSNFQKYSIQAILNGHHSLVTAATGSGKTLSAEFAIKYFTSLGKKVIYTSPIKALSNQKYHDFKKKFPEISFGLLTGDIKCGIGSDCIIMTCEILKNSLMNINTSFEIENDLACVIFDEIHYINDEDRGHVWEQSLIGLSQYKNVQLVMLSATIDEPETFAKWVAGLNPEKEVWLSGTSKRIVPLKHYSFLTCSDPYSRTDLTKEEQKFMTDCLKEPILLKDSEEPFNKKEYLKIQKFLSLSNHCSKQFVINNIIKYLCPDKLPAIFFTLSRKNVEYYPSLIEQTLLTDSKDIYRVSQECRSVISKLPNYKEFTSSPEYTKLVGLLEKGIAYHHSGMLSIYRELVEMMFEKGLVKLLFATETFSVGINMPTKTVIFDSFSKFDGNDNRFLRSHEYSQMSGRAGRRSIDTVGYVFHLNNLFKIIPNVHQYTEILSGSPQKIESRFNIDFNCVLGVLNKNQTDETDHIHNLVKFIEQSSVQSGLLKTSKVISNDIQEHSKNMKIIESKLKVPLQDHRRYMILTGSKQNNKTKKEIAQLESEYPTIISENIEYQKYIDYNSKISVLNDDLTSNENYINIKINKIIKLLQENSFVTDNSLTKKGIIAVNLQEADGLVISEVFDDLDKFTANQLVCIFSIFTSIDIEDTHNYPSVYSEIISNIEFYISRYKSIAEKEHIKYTQDINTSLINVLESWTLASNEQECMSIINDFVTTGGYLGSLIKSILKINNLALEVSRAIKATNGPVSLDYKLSLIPELTLKFIVTNQSLYL